MCMFTKYHSEHVPQILSQPDECQSSISKETYGLMVEIGWAMKHEEGDLLPLKELINE